jgi:hypothetical protein
MPHVTCVFHGRGITFNEGDVISFVALCGEHKELRSETNAWVYEMINGWRSTFKVGFIDMDLDKFLDTEKRIFEFCSFIGMASDKIRENRPFYAAQYLNSVIGENLYFKDQPSNRIAAVGDKLRVLAGG